MFPAGWKCGSPMGKRPKTDIKIRSQPSVKIQLTAGSFRYALDIMILFQIYSVARAYSMEVISSFSMMKVSFTLPFT